MRCRVVVRVDRWNLAGFCVAIRYFPLSSPFPSKAKMDKYRKRYLVPMIYYIHTDSGHHTFACHMSQETEMKPIFSQLMRLCCGAALMQGLTITRYETTPMATRSGEELTVLYNLHTPDRELAIKIQDRLEQQPGIELLKDNLA